MDQSLERLLEGLNAPAADGTRITTLTLPIAGPAPSPARVAQAMTNQASGNLSSDDATVLMQNALLLGYVPMNHHLRHGGNTVSFYRGPLVPLAVPAGARRSTPAPMAPTPTTRRPGYSMCRMAQRGSSGICSRFRTPAWPTSSISGNGR